MNYDDGVVTAPRSEGKVMNGYWLGVLLIAIGYWQLLAIDDAKVIVVCWRRPMQEAR